MESDSVGLRLCEDAVVVMRWFTRAWQVGDLSEEDFAQAPQAYARHVETIAPELPPPVLALATATPLSLHDARVVRWSWSPAERLSFQIECLDPREGYRTATITYTGSVELIGTDTELLAHWLGLVGTELVCDEIDVVSAGRYEHRHLLSPEGEFAVRFDEVSVTTEPSTDDAYSAAASPATRA